jgi:hypothetical protein
MTTEVESQGGMTQTLVWLGVAAIVIVVAAYFSM